MFNMELRHDEQIGASAKLYFLKSAAMSIQDPYFAPKYLFHISARPMRSPSCPSMESKTSKTFPNILHLQRVSILCCNQNDDWPKKVVTMIHNQWRREVFGWASTLLYHPVSLSSGFWEIQIAIQRSSSGLLTRWLMMKPKMLDIAESQIETMSHNHITWQKTAQIATKRSLPKTALRLVMISTYLYIYIIDYGNSGDDDEDGGWRDYDNSG